MCCVQGQIYVIIAAELCLLSEIRRLYLTYSKKWHFFFFYRSFWRTFSDIIDKWTGKRIQFIFFFPFSLLVIVFPNKNTCYVSNHTCVLYYVWCSGLIENKKHFLHQYLIAFFGKQNEQKDGKTFSHFISFYFTFFTIFKERKSILVIFMVKEQWS